MAWFGLLGAVLQCIISLFGFMCCDGLFGFVVLSMLAVCWFIEDLR